MFQTINVFDGFPWETNEFEFRPYGPDGTAIKVPGDSFPRISRSRWD